MAQTAFVGVTWQPLDLIDETKMDDMANGIQYVHDRTPRARYGNGTSIVHETGIKIMSGRRTIPRNNKSDHDAVNVYFGGFFSTGCQPLITTGIMSPIQTNIYCTFRGHSRLEPDHNGMIIEIEIGDKGKEKSKIRRNFAVHWLAMGY